MKIKQHTSKQPMDQRENQTENKKIFRQVKMKTQPYKFIGCSRSRKVIQEESL